MRYAAKATYAWILAGFGALLLAAYASMLPRGVWEDGYFVKRFAHNFWHHGTFAWNPSDGPVYAITAQTLQLLATLLYALDPQHLLLTLKAVLSLALFGTLLVIGRLAKRDESAVLQLVPVAVALSLPLVVEVIATGLETVLAMFVVACSVRAALRFERKQCGPWPPALAIALVYLTRPDAILIPIGLIALLVLPDVRRLRGVGLLVAIGIGLLLAGFRAYYGTTLPLSFYVKTRGLSDQGISLLTIFAAEKTTNAQQAAFFTLPFLYIALHERTRLCLALLGSGLLFGAYHYFFTVESMGYMSRFYLPALVPIATAAGLAYPAFLRTRRRVLNLGLVAAYLFAMVWALRNAITDHRVDIMIEGWHFYPFALACGVMLLAPRDRPELIGASIGAVLWGAALFCYPVHDLRIESDTAILLRQIAPRLVFRDLARLRDRLDVRTLFHTDMGAPGVLFPEARVVDLDGLLNKDITLRHLSFEDLCDVDHPDAIFVPKKAYKELRRQVQKSECIKNYRSVDGDPRSPLRIRADLVARWHAAGRNEP